MIMYNKIQNNAVGSNTCTTVSIFGYGVVWCAHDVTAILLQFYDVTKQSRAVFITNTNLHELLDLSQHTFDVQLSF